MLLVTDLQKKTTKKHKHHCQRLFYTHTEDVPLTKRAISKSQSKSLVL